MIATGEILGIWNRLSAIELASLLASGAEVPTNMEDRTLRVAHARELLFDGGTVNKPTLIDGEWLTRYRYDPSNAAARRKRVEKRKAA